MLFEGGYTYSNFLMNMLGYSHLSFGSGCLL